MDPVISVIVPVWNREGLIEKCLDSIVRQTRKPSELIIVDNNSTDKTVEVVEKWINRHSDSGIKFKLLVEKKRGACAARQKGLENADGEFLIFFDSDDRMLPNLIEKVNTSLLSNPGVDIVCWKCRIKLLDGSYRVPPFMPENPLEGHLIHTLFRPQGYIVRKTFLNEAKGWTKFVEVWNDFELGLRLIINKPKIIAIDEILAEIYSQEDSITGKDFSSKQGKWELTLNEMEEENERNDHPQKNKIRKILNYRKSILAALYFLEGNSKAACNLMNETLKDKSPVDKLLLKFSYHYTRRGFRGVWRIVRYFY